MLNYMKHNFAGVDFSDTVLFGADMQNAHLRGSKFRNADLEQVNLRNADLTATNFQGANLAHANLESTIHNGKEPYLSNQLRKHIQGSQLYKDANLDKVIYEDLTKKQMFELLWEVSKQLTSQSKDIASPSKNDERLRLYERIKRLSGQAKNIDMGDQE